MAAGGAQVVRGMDTPPICTLTAFCPETSVLRRRGKWKNWAGWGRLYLLGGENEGGSEVFVVVVVDWEECGLVVFGTGSGQKYRGSEKSTVTGGKWQ